MYLNAFAQGLEPLDMTGTDEFLSLLESADELAIPYREPVQYRARNVVANGLRFHVLEWGDADAQPLVLLHGGNQTAHSWDLVSLHLADRFHVVAFDQRGHGDSEWPRDCESTFGQMASDAFAIMTLLQLRSPIIVGHSMGGLVTLELLSRCSGVAERAVIVDVGPEVAPEGSKVVGSFVRSVGEYDSAEEFVERVSRYDPYRPIDHIRRTVRYNLLRRADGKFVSKHDTRRREIDGVRKAVRADWPRVAEPEKLDLPILLVRGGDSRVLTEELARDFVDRLPRGTLVTVPDAGHNVHSQNTTGFIEAVTPFLAGAQPASRGLTEAQLPGLCTRQPVHITEGVLFMCYDIDARPPLPPIAGGAADTEDVVLTASDGNRFAALLARPENASTTGIVVLPDVRGLFPFYEELAIRFAEVGHNAIAIDYFGRTAGVGKRPEDFDWQAHIGKTTQAGVANDVRAAVEYLRSPDGGSCTSVFTLGFCFGGSNSWNQAAEGHGLAGAIGFYGRPGPGLVDGAPGPLTRVEKMACPILALQAGNDDYIPASEVEEFDQALERAGVPHEVITYPGTPHSFFDRAYDQYQAECDDAWRRVLGFVEANTK